MDISVTNYAKSLSKGMHACQYKAITSALKKKGEKGKGKKNLKNLKA